MFCRRRDYQVGIWGAVLGGINIGATTRFVQRAPKSQVCLRFDCAHVMYSWFELVFCFGKFIFLFTELAGDHAYMTRGSEE